LESVNVVEGAVTVRLRFVVRVLFQVSGLLSAKEQSSLVLLPARFRPGTSKPFVL
jgi:hypothetical protein